MRDGGSAEGAGRVSGTVLSQRSQAGLAEDVVAGVAHVRAEVHVQAHGADVAFPVPRRHLLIVAAAVAAGRAPRGTLGRGKVKGERLRERSNTLYVFVLANQQACSCQLQLIWKPPVCLLNIQVTR